MSRPVSGLLTAALALALGACGEPQDLETLALRDSSLVPITADLHLADARAEATGEPRDSLHRAALDGHGLDSSAFAERLADATRTAADAAAFYRAVTDHLQTTVVQTEDSPSP